VDVMLVLLIVFIITVPVMKHAVNIDLPRAQNQAEDTKPHTVRLSVDAQGTYYWNEAKLDDSELESVLAIEASRNPQPELHIRGDVRADYEAVGRVVLAAQQAGIARIGFLTEPPPR